MTQTLTRKVRHGVKALLSERGIQDEILVEKLSELFIELKNEPFINANPAPWAHPKIQLVKRLTGHKVDTLLIPEVIQRLEPFAEEQITAVVREWKWRAYNSAALGWIDWLEKGIPQRNISAPPSNARRLPAGQSPASQLSVAEVNARLARGEL